MTVQPSTALITGASTGIGATYAARLAARGHDLLLVARDLQRLEALAGQLRGDYGVQVEVIKADLTHKPDLLALEQRLRTDARIGLLVNNAGVAMQGNLVDSDQDEVDRMAQLNILAVTRLAAAAAVNFSALGRGAIINLASVVAFIPERFNAAYTAGKAYVLSLSQSLHVELAGSGVQVQAVLPGVTRTEIWQRSGGDVAQIPAHMVMEVGEMVDAALAGFDQGEAVTIPALPDVGQWQAFMAARQAMGPGLSLDHAAQRYK